MFYGFRGGGKVADVHADDLPTRIRERERERDQSQENQLKDRNVVRLTFSGTMCFCITWCWSCFASLSLVKGA